MNNGLPHDAIAEYAALGCIVIAGSEGEEMLNSLSLGLFYDIRNEAIFRGLQCIKLNGDALNTPNLYQYLRDKKRVEEAGGLDYVTRLPDSVASEDEFPDYLRTLKDRAIRRAAWKVANDEGVAIEHLEETISRLKLPTISNLPAIADAAAFVAEDLPKPPELIEGILHQGSKLALGGSSKSFKTWTLLDLAISVAYGKPWLSHETRCGRVLYVNFEIQPWSWQHRLRAVTEAKGITFESGRLSVWNLRGKAADFSTLLPKIRDAVKQDFALIILDPIYKLYGFTDENKAGDVAALLNGIEELAVSTGAAIAFGQHFSKGNQSAKESIDRVSGSGVWSRDPDSLVMFTRHEEDNAFVVEATLRNFAPVDPFTVKWQCPLMVLDNSLDPARLKQAGGRPNDFKAEQLMEVLGEQSLTTGEWLKQAKEDTGMKDRTFYNLLKELQKLDRTMKSNINRKWTKVSK
jgi:hypothetical protein